MKGRFIAFLVIVCIGCLSVSGAYAGKPNKPGKPDTSKGELIVFTGDLVGGEVVEGCCPNAGPFPEYTMFLAGDEYDGYLFINSYGAGRDHSYKVQFWNDHDGPDHIAIEIIGGDIDYDKKTKFLTVTFVNESMVDLHTKEFIATVSFVLERSPD